MGQQAKFFRVVRLPSWLAGLCLFHFPTILFLFIFDSHHENKVLKKTSIVYLVSTSLDQDLNTKKVQSDQKFLSIQENKPASELGKRRTLKNLACDIFLAC